MISLPPYHGPFSIQLCDELDAKLDAAQQALPPASDDEEWHQCRCNWISTLTYCRTRIAEVRNDISENKTMIFTYHGKIVANCLATIKDYEAASAVGFQKQEASA